MRWSIRRAKKATEVVITFTKEMSQQSEMKTAMMNYVRHIKRLQRVWRRYCIWKDYILEVGIRIRVKARPLHLEGSCTCVGGSLRLNPTLI